ncbi:hypothetical protein T01_8949 [Trichinella spiralis]|uniref:Uncharacterized protein n=1 Tax=Trichinella spiralis TaxID=6334 RepID=A0A0V1AUX9_TRISP|nr:hypothetical protein T01_8949 [Trichinella spiralis]
MQSLSKLDNDENFILNKFTKAETIIFPCEHFESNTEGERAKIQGIPAELTFNKLHRFPILFSKFKSGVIFG